MATIQENIADLNTLKNNLEWELNLLKKQKEEYTKRKEKKEATEEEIKQLQDIKSVMTQENEGLAIELKKNQEIIDAMQNKIGAINVKLLESEKKEKELNDLIEKIKTKKEELKKTEKEIETEENELQKLTLANVLLKNDITLITEQKSSLKEEYRQIEKKYKDELKIKEERLVSDMTQSIKDKIKKKEAQLKSLENDISNRMSEIAEFDYQIENLCDSVKKEEKKLKKLQEELEIFDHKMGVLSKAEKGLQEKQEKIRKIAIQIKDKNNDPSINKIIASL
jgi:chromosome segregation ATPase